MVADSGASVPHLGPMPRLFAWRAIRAHLLATATPFPAPMRACPALARRAFALPYSVCHGSQPGEKGIFVHDSYSSPIRNPYSVRGSERANSV